MESIQTFSSLHSSFYDDVATTQKETLRDMIDRSYRETADSMQKLEKTTGLEWYKVKNTTLRHLAKLPAFSYPGLKIGGAGNVINAVKQNHGPSWRMIVEMGTDSIKACGVYPGGQSGNPGSKYYSNFVNKWVEGKYYDLVFLTGKPGGKSRSMPYTWSLKPE